MWKKGPAEARAVNVQYPIPSNVSQPDSCKKRRSFSKKNLAHCYLEKAWFEAGAHLPVKGLWNNFAAMAIPVSLGFFHIHVWLTTHLWLFSIMNCADQPHAFWSAARCMDVVLKVKCCESPQVQCQNSQAVLRQIQFLMLTLFIGWNYDIQWNLICGLIKTNTDYLIQCIRS